jgi:hypothetical protein
MTTPQFTLGEPDHVPVSVHGPEMPIVTVDSPEAVRFTSSPPEPTTLVVVPVTGPQGAPGEVTTDELHTYADQAAEDAVQAHVEDEEPHPPYDDMPSLVLLFENRLV